MPRLLRGLSARLLLLTVAFVLIAEAFIFVPSAANAYRRWVRARLDQAEIAALAALAAPDRIVEFGLEQDLTAAAGVLAIEYDLNQGGMLALQAQNVEGPPRIVHDLRIDGAAHWIAAASRAMWPGPERLIEARGAPRFDAGFQIMVVARESEARRVLYAYSRNILSLSLVISLFTGGLVYATLRAAFVRPLTRLAASMSSFKENPRDPSRIVESTGRVDEIGALEASLNEMQTALQRGIEQRERLAQLGEAVAKINHDLRNILASAQLISDRLRRSDDPLVRRLAPKLFASIDRAQRLCEDTLRYGRPRAEQVRPTATPLRAVADDAAETARLGAAGSYPVEVALAPDLVVHADPDQLNRILLNLIRNAIQALERSGKQAGRVRVTASRLDEPPRIAIDVEDDGPGVPVDAQANLFEVYASGARGSGLGLAIARDLARGHGGDVVLWRSDEHGAVFRTVLPDALADDVQPPSTSPVNETPSRRGSAAAS